MDLTFGGADRTQGPGSAQVSRINSPQAKGNEDLLGKALNYEMTGQAKKLKATRFKLSDNAVEMNNEVMEQWVDKCLAQDKDVLKEVSVHKFSKTDMRKATTKYGIDKQNLNEQGMKPDFI